MMGDTRKPGKNKSGEKQPGEHHYNPGDKTTDTVKHETEQENNAGRTQSRREHTRERE